MVKVTLTFDGTAEEFQKAICADENDGFDFIDSLFWEMDYNGSGSWHITEFGDIEIKVE